MSLHREKGPHVWGARGGLVLITAVSLHACDRGDAAIEPSVLPAPPAFEVVATNPQKEETNVPLDRAIRIRFNRFLQPNTAVRQSILVTGGTIDPDGGVPLAGEVFLEPRYDLVERVMVYRLSAGRRWQPGVRYTVTLRRASEHQGLGFRAYDGSELATNVTFAFTTTHAFTQALTEHPPPPVSYCSACVNGVVVPGARDVLQAACAVTGCHAVTPGVPPPLGLDLSNQEALSRLVLDHPARETITGPSSVKATVGSSAFGKSMPIVAPGLPANSYLMYKVLLRGDAWDETRRWGSALGPGELVGGLMRPSPDELGRLRDAFVIGQPMPLSGSLGFEGVRVLQAWITAGAPLEDDAHCASVTQCPAARDAGTDASKHIIDAGIDGSQDAP